MSMTEPDDETGMLWCWGCEEMVAYDEHMEGNPKEGCFYVFTCPEGHTIDPDPEPIDLEDYMLNRDNHGE